MNSKRLFQILMLVGLSGLNVAQAATPGAADVIRSDQQDKTPVMPDQSEPVAAPVAPEEAVPEFTASDVKVKVSEFTFSGNTVIESAALAAAVASDVGRELDSKELLEVTKKVRRVYVSRGYILAVAYLPKQEIHDGKVEIAILEGRLGEIKVNVASDARFGQNAAQRIVDAHLKSGDLITDAKIERPLLLIRDMAGLDAHSTINPGKELGTADLTIEVIKSEDKRFIDGQIDIDNYGNRYAGEHRGGATVNLNSPLGFGDRLSLRGQFSFDETETNLVSLNYILPVGPYGTKVGASYSKINYKLGKNQEFIDQGVNGEAVVAGVNLIQPFVRRRGMNLFGKISYDYKDTDDYVDAAFTDDHKKVKSGTLELSGDLQDHYKGYNYGSLSFSSGDVEITDPNFKQNDQLSYQTEGHFSKVDWSFARLQQLPAEFYLFFSLTGQAASKNLQPIEKLALGGPNAVRAYPVGDAQGDDGQIYTLELRRKLPYVKLFSSNIIASAFYDWGQVDQWESPTAADLHNSLQRKGVGFGLSADSPAFQVNATVAWPKSGSPATGQSDTADRDPRFYLRAVKTF